MIEESTTPDPVELVRKQVEALDRGDLDGVMSNVAEDVVLDGAALEDHFEGRVAVRDFLDQWFGLYEELDFELEEVSHLGDGVVFAVVSQDGHVVGSSGLVRQREGWVYLCVGGSIGRLTTYPDIDEARTAAERLAQERGWAVSGESTTPDLVRLVREQAEAANRRDLNAVMNAFAEDAIMTGGARGFPPSEGRAAIGRFIEDWFDAYEELHFEFEEVSDLGNGVVFGVLVQEGRPVGTAAHVGQREGWVYIWARGLIARLETTYFDIAEARAAAERLAAERG